MTDEETLQAYFDARSDADKVYRQRFGGSIICAKDTAALFDGVVGEAREALKAQLVVEGRAKWAVE